MQVNGCSCVQLTGCLVEDETTNESTLVFELTKVRSAINFLHDCVLSNSQLHLELKVCLNETIEIMEICRDEIQTQINSGTLILRCCKNREKLR